jgi:Transcriptional regulatory protein, C terminal
MATSSEVFHFDEFTLDVRERCLMRGTEAVRLPPKAYDVLVALVQQRGRLVTKDELLKRLWSKLFVEELARRPAVRRTPAIDATVLRRLTSPVRILLGPIQLGSKYGYRAKRHHWQAERGIRKPTKSDGISR